MFDLKNMNDLWCIVFIAEYIKKNDALYRALNDSNQVAEISSAFPSFNRVQFDGLDGINISNRHIEPLKHAVNIINSLRNSIEHGRAIEEKILRIDDSNFRVEIPIEYLDGFCKGRIIVNDSDKVIVETTNDTVSPLLEVLNYDVYKLGSFFYNVRPEVLSMFLDVFENDIIKMYQLSPVAFNYPDNVIRLRDELNGIDITQLPDDAFVHPDNVCHLLRLVENQYERLKEFPVEYYTCNDCLVDEMFQTYNANVSRSIFGINSPKIIASLVYANSVMRKYQDDDDFVTLDPESFVFPKDADELDSIDSLQYGNNWSEFFNDSRIHTFGPGEYLSQFVDVGDGRGTMRSKEQIEKYILRKIRNSAAHFRIGPVKNSSGNIVDGNIALYDKRVESGNPNFFYVMDVADYVEIIHDIEIQLQGQLNNVLENNTTTNNEEDNKVSTISGSMTEMAR